MRNNNNYKLLKAKEVARLLNISQRQVYAMAQEGTLPAIRLGKRLIRFDEEEILRWLNERKEDRDESPGK